MKYRQEVLNVILAQLLQEQVLVVAPEQIFKISVKKARKMPDVILDLQGLRLAIEGEYGLNNLAKEKAVKSALGRVEDGIAHISDRSDASLRLLKRSAWSDPKLFARRRQTWNGPIF